MRLDSPSLFPLCGSRDISSTPTQQRAPKTIKYSDPGLSVIANSGTFRQGTKLSTTICVFVLEFYVEYNGFCFGSIFPTKEGYENDAFCYFTFDFQRSRLKTILRAVVVWSKSDLCKSV